MKTGEVRSCKVCGTEFYVQQNQIADTFRNTGTYCSRLCKGKAQAEKTPPWARPQEKTVHAAGYLKVWAPDHPRAHGGRVLEHILVMEQVMGRPLSQQEHVHHLNGDKADNRPENLVLLTPSEHQKLHAATDHVQAQPRRVAVTCAECGQDFQAERGRAFASNPRNQRRFCSMACRRAAWPREMQAKKLAKRNPESEAAEAERLRQKQRALTRIADLEAELARLKAALP